MNNFGKIAEKIGVLVQEGGTAIIGQINLSEESSQERRNRKRLLDNVRDAWIKGVLESSLYEQVLITLSLEERPQAVDRPWSLELKESDQASRLLPEGTSIMEPFDQLGTGGTLLILGNPGSGKTLALLELARDLIKRAEEEADQPIPVVLNLSSWAAQKHPLAAWVVEEINAKYRVPKKVGEEWVKGQKLLLLLDGLDEIRDLSARDECVTALNAFQREQETAMVVCCRVKDYQKLDNRLEGKSALVIQPLSPEQIRNYLKQLKTDLTGLKALLEQDTALQELAQSPLMLNIMVLAYQGFEIEEGLEPVTAKERMQQLFDDYIDRMFTRSREFAHARNLPSQEKESYSRQQATRWLVWLARQMLQRSQTVFLIEKLQPDWLPSGNLKVLYKAVALLNSGLIFWLILWLITGLIGGLTIGLSDWLIFWLIGWLIFGLILGLIGGLILGLIGWLIGRLTKLFEEIKTVEAVKWSWKNPWRNMLYWNKVGLIFGLIFGLVFVLTSGQMFGLYFGLYFGLIEWLTYGLIYGLIGGLIGGPISTEIENKNQPNQGIWVSAKNAIIFGSIFGLIFGLSNELLSEPRTKLRSELSRLSGLNHELSILSRPSSELSSTMSSAMSRLTGLSSALSNELSSTLMNASNTGLSYELIGLYFGLIAGLIGGFANGGLAFIQHFTLRFFLYRTNCIPWKIVPFLECCIERLFLYRVGGGYIFVHRLLMEHFAQMEK
jgi:eukaryotic-like serine/threonine-protein kinase